MTRGITRTGKTAAAAPATHQRVAVLLGLLAVMAGASPALAQVLPATPGIDRPVPDGHLTVEDPFLELHSGPGRGFPVFFVVERGRWIAIELRRTDWFLVRTQEGARGWVPRAQMERTLAGGATSLRDLLVDGLLARRVEMGGAWGRFEGETMLKLWAHVRASEVFGVELASGQVQGVFSGTDFWQLSLVAEPWGQATWSPFASVGLGQFRNFPNSSLVGARFTDARLASAGLGLRWRAGPRLIVRADWTLYTAFVGDDRSPEYRALTAGLAFSF
jgi:hypothetical protein